MNIPKNAVPVLIEKPEKVITMSDLKGSDHVGFIDNMGSKGYVAFIGEDEGQDRFVALLENSDVRYNICNITAGGFYLKSFTISDALDLPRKTKNFRSISKLYKFNTRKDLYKWLAED